MLNKAEKIILDNRGLWMSKPSQNNAFVSGDNTEVIEFLQSEPCCNVREIDGQETWVYSDNSYITRNGDEYWTGSDISKFESLYE